MNILMVSTLWPPTVLGGAEIHAARLATELRQRGHDVDVLTHGVSEGEAHAVSPWPYRLDTFAGQPGWKRLAFRAVDVYNPLARRALHELIGARRPDVVHSHAVAALSTSVLMEAGRSNAAHVHTVHDYWLLCRRTTLVRRSGRPCDTTCLSCRGIGAARGLLLRGARPDVVIAPSEAVAERHRELPWASGRIVHLSHPVDRPPAARRRPPPPPGGPITFGFVGQVTAIKGVPTLLDAFGPLAAEGHRLRVAGKGPALEQARRAGPAVDAVGWLDTAGLETFYESVDCLVVPSEWPENAPLVVAEARNRSVPVIASRIGGLPEAVDRASRPLLFEPGDAGALRATMRRFAVDPAAFANREEAGASWDEYVDSLVALYQRAIEGRRRR